LIDFISFGGDSNLGKSFEAEKSNDIGGTSGRFYESHGLKELSQEIAKQKGEFMKQALNSGEGKNQDRLYEQAVERLMSLRALIEREYPKIKDIRKKVADVKYYFDLGYQDFLKNIDIFE